MNCCEIPTILMWNPDCQIGLHVKYHIVTFMSCRSPLKKQWWLQISFYKSHDCMEFLRMWTCELCACILQYKVSTKIQTAWNFSVLPDCSRLDSNSTGVLGAFVRRPQTRTWENSRDPSDITNLNVITIVQFCRDRAEHVIFEWLFFIHDSSTSLATPGSKTLLRTSRNWQATPFGSRPRIWEFRQ